MNLSEIIYREWLNEEDYGTDKKIQRIMLECCDKERDLLDEMPLINVEKFTAFTEALDGLQDEQLRRAFHEGLKIGVKLIIELNK